MGSTFTWLHIADLHLTPSLSWDANFVLQHMIEDVRVLVSERGIRADAVFVTGDLTRSGQKEEFILVSDFISRMSEASGVPSDHFFFVPGNHDVDRNHVTFGARALRDALLSGGEEDLGKLEVDDSSLALLFEPLSNYASFVPSQSKISPKKLFYTQVLSLPQIPVKITVVGLNSSWLAFDDNPPLLGRRQAQLSLQDVDGDSLVIALVHHPLSALPQWDSELVGDIIDHHCDFLLRGHLHRTRLEVLSQSPYRCSRIAAGGTYIGGRALNGYNAVQVDFGRRTITAFLRQYRPEAGIWVEDNIFRDPEPGLFQWPLPKRFFPTEPSRPGGTEGEVNDASLVWIRVDVVTSNTNIDTAEVLKALGELLDDVSINLRNVQTGSLWLQVRMKRRSYLQLLEMFAAEDEQLGSLADRYKVLFVGPKKPLSKSDTDDLPEPKYKKLRVFVASPGDVQAERNILGQVVEELNRTVADSRGIVLELVKWETHARPSMGRPQEIINRQLEKADFLVGLLSSRFGTPTGVAGSGTEEEFIVAYDSWSRSGHPQILFYFKQEQRIFKSPEELDQMRKVLEFKERLGKKGLFWEFSSVKEFEDAVRNHLTHLIVSENA